MDKLIWIWLANSSTGLRVEHKRLSPAQHTQVRAIIFKEPYTLRNLLAVRKRNMAYRRAGCPSALCFEQTGLDLLDYCAKMPAISSQRSTGKFLMPKVTLLGRKNQNEP